MRTALAVAALALLVAACGPTNAETTAPAGSTAQTDPAADPCEDAPNQLALNSCWSAAAKSASAGVDERLGKVNQLLRSKGKKQAEAAFTQAQELWARYRDAYCKGNRALYGDGSGAAMAESVCVRGVSLARTKELDALYEDLNR